MFVKALIFFALNRNHPSGKLFLLSLKNREINNCKTGRLCERFICVQYSLADLRGGGATAQNFLNFMPFFGKFWQNHRLASPPRGLAPPATGNPGSASGTL